MSRAQSSASASALLARDLGFALRRQAPDHRVEQIGHSPTVGGADGVRLFPAEGVELRGFEFALVVVGLVGGNQHRRLGRAQQVGGLDVRGRQAGDRVDHQDDQIGLVDCQSRLLLDLLLDGVAGMDLQAAGVDDDEAPAVPLGVAVHAVACGACAILDDGGAVADDSVEKGALADVRTADNGNDGK